MKILVIKPSSLGDVIHALPFLDALKNSFPDSIIDWVISKNLKGLLEDNPLINKLILLNKDSWKSLRNIPRTLSEFSALNKTLKTEDYDIVVDLQGLLRSGLIAFSTSKTLKIGFSDAREGSKFMYDRKILVNGNMHAVDKCLMVAKGIGADIKQVKFPIYVDTATVEKIASVIGNSKEYVVVMPSSRWVTKRWPAEKYASLISKIPATVIITGGKEDKDIAEEILRLAMYPDNIIDLCGRTDLKELAALIWGAKAVVTNDSGPMHIAAGLEKPVIALFGPTDPVKTGPYGWQKNGNLSVIKADVPCSPCRKKKKCKEFICMEQISIEEVYKALKKYL